MIAIHCACCDQPVEADGWPARCTACGFVAHSDADQPSVINPCWQMAGRAPPDEPPARSLFTAESLPCRHRQATGQSERCNLCGMRGVEAPLFHCEEHGETVTVRRHRSTPRENYRDCRTCEEREP